MEMHEIKTILEQGLNDSEVHLDADGNKLSLHIISDVFEGLSRVKRQQKVYALLNDKIASGEVHAVSMKTLTRAESLSREQPGAPSEE
jgi:acid stress-induced BolA-like protein IbaG/YrbA